MTVGASRERARITRRAQDGGVHMQRSLPSSSYPARSTLDLNHMGVPSDILTLLSLTFTMFSRALHEQGMWHCQVETDPPPPPPKKKKKKSI